MIIWLTGQPGSGKTVLAGWLQSITELNSRVMIIDGDDIREIFNNKDYSEQGRRKNVEFVQNMALFLHNKNVDVIVSLVSPYKDQREEFKENMQDKLVELYIHCEDERGREKFHVSNYEPPVDNFIDVNTTNDDEYTSFQKIREKINLKRIIFINHTK